MRNSPPQQETGSTYPGDRAAQEVQTGRVRIREGRSGSKDTGTDTMHTKPHTGLPDAPADHPATMPHHGRRWTAVFAVLGVLALLVILALVAVDSPGSESEIAPAGGTYTGDWKDLLTERGRRGAARHVAPSANGRGLGTQDLARVGADHEAARSARANESATARLQGQADEYEVARNARANRAATARLQGAADQHRRHGPDLSVEPAG